MTDEPRISEPQDCAGDASAYVLGALEPHETFAFLAHLERCSVCREEVDSLMGVVQALPMATVQYPASRRLRRRVMRAVKQGSPSIERSRERGLRHLWARALGSGVGVRIASAGAALTVAAGAAVAGLELSGGAAATVFQASVAGVSGSAQVRLVNGHAELVVRHLTPPGRGRVYEVWLKSGDAAPVPASVLFSVSSGGDADVGLPNRLHGVYSVLVTSEPLGGTSVPTRKPVIVANLD